MRLHLVCFVLVRTWELLASKLNPGRDGVSSSPCAKRMPLLLLLLLLLHLPLLLPLILLLLFRGAARHFSPPLRGWRASVHAAPLSATWPAS